MSYLLNHLFLYLLAAAVLGALVGWLMRRCFCNRDLAAMQDKLNEKSKLLDNKEHELEKATADSASAKAKANTLETQYAMQTGELTLMTSRWKSTLNQAKQLPSHKAWINQLQNKYQEMTAERDEYENLAYHFYDSHAEANQKIIRLNNRVTKQERHKFRLDDMVQKVDRLNNKVTTSENNMRGMYGMVKQIQHKWNTDRIDATHLRELTPKLEQEKNQAQSKLTTLTADHQNDFEQQKAQHQTEIEQFKKKHQTEVLELEKRINELKPLEGDLPGQDTKFNRFIDKIRLVGTSKNTILGRAYNQIDEIKTEVGEKERVFVDTCEEKDAVIEDLRNQVRTAENRAQAACADSLQDSRSKIQELEQQVSTLSTDASLLTEHEHTIEAFKNKISQSKSNDARYENMLREHKQTIEALKNKLEKNETTTPKPSRTKPTKVKEEVSKPMKGLKAPAKGLKIKAATTKDDLKIVKGIGPVMEKKLNNYGVYSFEQLGSLSSDDIEALTQTLESFPGRIERDKWVSQSRKQFKKKYGKSID